MSRTKGRKPTVKERSVIESYKLTSDSWFVLKSKDDEIHLIHKYVGRVKVIPNYIIRKRLTTNGR